MNYRMMGFVIGRILLAEALLLLLPLAVTLGYGETPVPFLIPMALLAAAGGLLSFKRPKQTALYARDGLAVVALAWIAMSVFGALPFYISGDIPKFVDCIFETVSGFTTTGATILTEVEPLAKGILFWRSFTHWVGGMGVLVFVMAIIPLSDKNSLYLMRAEMPGPTAGKLVPKAMSTAKILYAIYIGMTLVQVVLMMLGGVSLYDSLVYTFGTAGTGGFSIHADSIAHYHSVYIDVVVTVFMILFGSNFNLFYLILIGQVVQALKSEELRWYLGIILASIAMIAVNIYSLYGSVAQSVRYSAFQVGSIITTTGYATADFAQWPYFSQTILLLLMVLGACAGSTGGGIKTIRLIILLKSIRREIRRMVHPRSVGLVRAEGKVVEEDTVHGVHVYLITYFVIMFLSVLLVSINGFDLVTTISSVFTCLNNVGPGLGPVVGPMGSFAPLSSLSKIVLSLDMLIGRLEIFPILLLIMPALWRKH